MNDRPTISITELKNLQEQATRQTLSQEEVKDFATAALVVLRGMSRGDKLRVIRRMRRMCD